MHIHYFPLYRPLLHFRRTMGDESQKTINPRSLEFKSGKPLLELTLVKRLILHEQRQGPPIARTPLKCVAMFPSVENTFPFWITREFRSSRCWNSHEFNYLLIFQIDFEALKDLSPLQCMCIAGVRFRKKQVVEKIYTITVCCIFEAMFLRNLFDSNFNNLPNISHVLESRGYSNFREYDVHYLQIWTNIKFHFRI